MSQYYVGDSTKVRVINKTHESLFSSPMHARNSLLIPPRCDIKLVSLLLKLRHASKAIGPHAYIIFPGPTIVTGWTLDRLVSLYNELLICSVWFILKCESTLFLFFPVCSIKNNYWLFVKKMHFIWQNFSLQAFWIETSFGRINE